MIFRAFGQGYSGLTKFCSLMDMHMPKPMTDKNQCSHYEKCDVAKNVAHETMQDAASEIKGDDMKELQIQLCRLMEVGRRGGILHLMMRKQQF